MTYFSAPIIQIGLDGMVVHPTQATKKKHGILVLNVPCSFCPLLQHFFCIEVNPSFQRPPESASYIEKIKKRKLNYAAMRADGELPREESQALCKQADDEIARLEQELKSLSPAPEPQTVSSDMKAIYDFLSQKVDVHGARLAPELIDQFVEVVTPIADYSYRWKLSTGCKKSKEERTDLMAVSEKPLLTFTIDFETAKRYREANKMPHQFRRAAWTDLTVEVYL